MHVTGVLLDMPFKLVVMHIHGEGQLDRNFNFGVSVKHIEFVRHILSACCRTSKSLSSLSEMYIQKL